MDIKTLRNQTGLSQSKFANLFHIPVRTLQEWEQGNRTPPVYVIKMMEELLELRKFQDNNNEAITIRD